MNALLFSSLMSFLTFGAQGEQRKRRIKFFPAIKKLTKLFPLYYIKKLSTIMAAVSLGYIDRGIVPWYPNFHLIFDVKKEVLCQPLKKTCSMLEPLL
ncbi:MAG TPA: hypothetical protein VJ861_09790, partial [Treponemataceae bacterium]|nr:hypothetical protein [Treponemataceae bacterium]